MKTIALGFSDDLFARLNQAAECRYGSLSELLKAWLVDLLEEPTDPFDPRGQRRRERDEEFLRRIA